MAGKDCNPLACPRGEICPTERSEDLVSAEAVFRTIVVTGVRRFPDARAVGVPRVHLAGLWSRGPCWCGMIHHPCEEVNLRIYLGVPPRRDRNDGIPTVTLIPYELRWVEIRCPTVVAPEGHDFDDWARAAIRNLSEGMLLPGFVCYDAQDVQQLLAKASRFRLVHRSGSAPLPSLVAAALGDASFEESTGVIHLGLHGDGTDSLGEIHDAVDLVTEAVGEKADIVVYATASSELPHSASMLFAAR
jgi:hypothetical protein